MLWKAFVALAAAAPFASALLRFPCSQLVTERFDPLVTPGRVSPHLHQIVGGNAFNISMDINNDLPALSTCTTCRFKEDFSNYWTAVLFFKHPNGSFIRVPQIANQYTGSPNGGMTVYYIQPPNNEKTTAFRKGFRMIVGNPMVRRDLGVANTATARALTHRCFGANFGGSIDHPGGPQDTVELPNRPCAGGIRSNIYFPSCWDGVNLDSPNHSSHVAWPLGNPGPGGNFFFGGTCPSTHPVRIPMLFVEIVWDTSQFNSMWPSGGANPFVYSYGDATGYGQHGDYVFGWEGDSLQRAMDQCTDMSGIPEQCRALTVLNDATINRCTKAAEVPEVTTGYLKALPGCNPIQTGPASATVPASCDAVSTTGVPPGQPTGNPGGPGPTTTVNVPTTTQGNPSQPTQTKWGQCGGQGWNGPTVCAAGSTCRASNQWYSQCI